MLKEALAVCEEIRADEALVRLASTRMGNGIAQAVGIFKKAAMVSIRLQRADLVTSHRAFFEKGVTSFLRALEQWKRRFLLIKTVTCACSTLPTPPPSSLPKSPST